MISGVQTYGLWFPILMFVVLLSLFIWNRLKLMAKESQATAATEWAHAMEMVLIIVAVFVLALFLFTR